MEIGIPQSWRKEKERYRLIGSHCKTCGKNYFPFRGICPKCRRKGEIVEKEYSGKGEIYSYTIVYAPPTGFKMKAPYILAIVKLDEGPKVLGLIRDAKPEEVKIGAKVEQILRKWIEEDGNGLIHYGYSFRIV